MLATISSALVIGIVSLAAWLLPKYLEARVAEAARGAVDLSVGRSLAEQRLQLDRQLEAYRDELTRNLEGIRQTLAFDREKFGRDYGLFATRRNEVYAETFGLLERARGGFAKRFAALLSYRDFGRSPVADLKALAERLKLISAAEREEFINLIANGRLDEARKLANRLNEKDELRQANRAFYEFRNACVLNALYFSSEIDALLTQAVHELALLTVYSDEIIEDDEDRVAPRKASEQVTMVDVTAGQIRQAMRRELQAGFAESNQTSVARRDA